MKNQRKKMDAKEMYRFLCESIGEKVVGNESVLDGADDIFDYEAAVIDMLVEEYKDTTKRDRRPHGYGTEKIGFVCWVDWSELTRIRFMDSTQTPPKKCILQSVKAEYLEKEDRYGVSCKAIGRYGLGAIHFKDLPSETQREIYLLIKKYKDLPFEH